MAHSVDILTSLAKQDADALELKTKHHFEYSFDRPLLCLECDNFHEGMECAFNDWCKFSAEDILWDSTIKDPNGDGTNAILTNGIMSLVYRRMGERPEFNVLFCNEFKLRRINYDEYIKSKKWQRKRRLALQRADFRCERCGSAINLQVHHITYDHLGNESFYDLIVLCNKCHGEIHEKDLST